MAYKKTNNRSEKKEIFCLETRRKESAMHKKYLQVTFLFWFLLYGVVLYGGQATPNIIVNGKRLSEAQIQMLRDRLGIPSNAPISSGEYWYDNFSGLWGKRGGPTLGQIMPGLELGGPLRADASNGNTGVFINGREIHPLEFAYLQRLFGSVNMGRYWLNAWGIGGYEGGPPIFDIRAAAAAVGSAGGGYGGYTQRTPFGSIGGDSNCSYYLHPSGSSVLNCP